MNPSTPDSTNCAKGTLVLSTVQAIRLTPALCRRWACPGCGRRKARRLARRIALVRARRFITLTIRPRPGEPLEEAIDRINVAWRNLWKRVKRERPHEKYGYVKVIELTKRGTPHLHILSDVPFLSQRWLSEQWYDLTGSYIVDIRKIESPQHLAKYVSKYLTKSHGHEFPRRRWSQSNGFVPPEPPPQLEEGELPLLWRFRAQSLESLEEWLASAGYVLAEGWWRPPVLALPNRSPSGSLSPPAAAP